MKYYKEIFCICFILFLYLSCRNLFYIEGKTDQIDQNISIKKNVYNDNQRLLINDTFSIDGSLISTIPLKMSSSSSSSSVYSNDSNMTHSINTFNNKTNSQKTIEQGLAATNMSNVSSIQSIKQQQQQQNLLSNTKSNKSSNISDNLVSLLSGIIIESIHNGNPTINNANNSLTSKPTNNNDIILTSGKWHLDVENGNVTKFYSKFLMISANNTGFHWYSMKNFKSNEKLFLGNGNSAAVNGKLDFFTAKNSTKKTTNVLLTINNLELIQLTPLDNVISSYFHDFPLYGTIDSIKIKN